jgi:anti-sigma-K factor RskA
MNNSESHTNRFEELCAAYVLDALSVGEQREFEAIMADADQQQIETYHSLRSAANNLALTTERAEPSASVKKQLMERVREEAAQSDAVAGKEEQGSSPGRFRMAIAASVVLLLATLALIGYSESAFQGQQSTDANSQAPK